MTRQAAPTWPGVPQNFQATPGDGKVTLSWEAPSSWGSYTAAGYELEYRVGNSGTWQYSGIPALGASATSYEFTGSYGSTTVTNGVTYQFRIRSKVVNPIDSADIWTSNYTAAASATPQAAGLAAPGSFALTAGDGQFTVSWDVVATANSYEIEVKRTGSTSTVTVTPGSATSKTISLLGVTSVANGTTYTVRMRACTGSNPFAQDAGCGAWTAAKTVTPEAPAVPGSVTLTPVAHSDGTPALRVSFTNPKTSAYPYAVLQVRLASATGPWPAQSDTDSLPSGAAVAAAQGSAQSPVSVIYGAQRRRRIRRPVEFRRQRSRRRRRVQRAGEGHDMDRARGAGVGRDPDGGRRVAFRDLGRAVERRGHGGEHHRLQGALAAEGRGFRHAGGVERQRRRERRRLHEPHARHFGPDQRLGLPGRGARAQRHQPGQRVVGGRGRHAGGGGAPGGRLQSWDLDSFGNHWGDRDC